MSSSIVRDPRENVTKKEFGELKHRTFTMRDTIAAINNTLRFYRGELLFIKRYGAKALGSGPSGEPRDAAYYEALIKKNEADLKEYQPVFNGLMRELRELKPFVQAKDWYRDLGF
jgi:hypothetical protein